MTWVIITVIISLAWLRYFGTLTPGVRVILCKLNFHHPVRTVLDSEPDVYRCKTCFTKMKSIHTSQGTLYEVVDR